MTEADYLTRQQEQAKSAIGAVIADMKSAAFSALDVKEWTRQHPWVVSGVAAAAGFAAGMLLTPGKDETFKKFWEEKWESIKDRLTPAPAPETASRLGAPPPPQRSTLGALLSEALKVIGPSLGALLSGVIAGEQVKDEVVQHGGNGHADPMPPPT